MGCPWSPGAVTVSRTTVFLLNILANTFMCGVSAKRHVIYWNATNSRLTEGDLSVEVDLNDYLDIYCPHYPSPHASDVTSFQPLPENLALYLVAEDGFRGCVKSDRFIKRWECNDPSAPFGPVRFSEKIQRFTPFTLGFEFVPRKHYYYISLPTGGPASLPCMKLRVTVCCEPATEESRPWVRDGSNSDGGMSSVRVATVSLHLLVSLFHFL
ncbi:hypothetical protein DPEC_G00142210 [Dallia pectoralis]|uniref:Uncharacterized protein n=1 Tax=Dallia pectoralis TaxID=75939 RepID=A0ACC2GN95_DALPE|nr:hypothetical protein DPEC_G00142210 [Dallia pectoralis]